MPHTQYLGHTYTTLSLWVFLTAQVSQRRMSTRSSLCLQGHVAGQKLQVAFILEGCFLLTQRLQTTQTSQCLCYPVGCSHILPDMSPRNSKPSPQEQHTDFLVHNHYFLIRKKQIFIINFPLFIWLCDFYCLVRHRLVHFLFMNKEKPGWWGCL